MFVKICGITTRAAVDAAVASGADAVGFVFAESPRRVTAEHAVALCEGLPAHVLRVAVMRHPTADLWQHVLQVFAPDWLQTDAEDLATIALPAGCVPLPVYRDDRIVDDAAAAPRLLFEGRTSGSGERADWAQARRLARRSALILAGGLRPENVADAIAAVRPWGVDVSSGVERRKGEKDPVKIRDFIARVRAVANASGRHGEK